MGKDMVGKRACSPLRAVSISLLFGVVLAWCACQVEDSIQPEHKDSSLNWIEDVEFISSPFPSSSPEPSTDASPSPSPLIWRFAYNDDSDDGFEYMSMEELNDVPGPSQAADAKVYRLAIRNLYYDGDFSLASPGAADSLRFPVVATNSGNQAQALVELNAERGHGNSLFVKTDNKNDSVGIVLSTNMLNTLSGGLPIASSQYSFRASVYSLGSSLSYSFGDDTEGTFGLSPSLFNDQLMGDFTQASGSSAVFYVKNAPFEGYLDDMRVTRTDITLSYIMDLAADNFSPSLIPGRYRFRIWVKDDPGASDCLLSASGLDIKDPYLAKAFSISLTGLPQAEGQGSANEAFLRPTAGWAEWTQLSLGGEETFQFDTQSRLAFLRISISPTDLYTAAAKECGRILIANPELNFILDSE